MGKASSFSDELSALAVVLGALEPLDEEKREFVLRTAMDRLQINTTVGATHGNGFGQSRTPGGDGGSHNGPTPELARMNPKEFMRRKQPATDVQRIACLAYYLTHARNTAQFKTADLTKLNTEAAGGKFSNAAVAVRNATGLSGFLAPGGGGRKQIAALGEDIVNALPDQEQVRVLIAGAKKRRRGRKPKKKVAQKG